MQKIYIVCLSVLVLSSCKTKKSVTETTPSTEQEIPVSTSPSVSEPTKTTNTLILKHYELPKEFETLQINTSINTSEIDMELSGDIRIEKGKQILITVRKFGITGAKVLITPNRISYYETIGNTYYDGNFSFINNKLGTTLDYEKIENLLIGKALYNLQESNLTPYKSNNNILISDKKTDYLIEYTFDNQMRLLKELIKPLVEDQYLNIQYQGNQQKNQLEIPKTVSLKAKQKKVFELTLQYNSFSVNENLHFSYKIPSSSKLIKF